MSDRSPDMLGCVNTGTTDWSRRFPRLFEDSYVDYAAARISYVEGAAPEDLVTRLHIVAVTDHAEVVVCRSAQGGRFLPGGTRELDESLRDLAERELIEEAGAVLSGELVHFSSHRADSELAEPYRAHFPHPRAFWGYAVGRVRITGPPSNPPDGENVVEVLTLPPSTAADYLAEEDPLHADVLRHADALGLIQRP
jgi:8-oxo-dGTP diphosphatase